MNSIFSIRWKSLLHARRAAARALIAISLVILSATPFIAQLRAQTASDPTAEFKRISEELSAARLSGGDDNKEQMEKALAYLDSVAISNLNIAAEPNLDGANRGLAGLAPHTPPIGENYRLVKLGGASRGLCTGGQFRPGRTRGTANLCGLGREITPSPPGSIVLSRRTFWTVILSWCLFQIPRRCLLQFPAARMTCRQACFRPGSLTGIISLIYGIRTCSSSPVTRPTKADSSWHTAPRWMRIDPRSASRCLVTCIVFRRENGRESKRLICRCQAPQRNKN